MYYSLSFVRVASPKPLLFYKMKTATVTSHRILGGLDELLCFIWTYLPALRVLINGTHVNKCHNYKNEHLHDLCAHLLILLH